MAATPGAAAPDLRDARYAALGARLVAALRSGAQRVAADLARAISVEAERAGAPCTVDAVLAAARAQAERAAEPTADAAPTAAAPPTLLAHLAPADATHHHLATLAVEELRARHGAAPVAADGALWTPDERGLWRAMRPERLAVEIGAMYSAHRRCARGSDYRQIAELVCAMTADPEFFAAAPVGVVCPGGVWMLRDARLAVEPLRVEHRQRYAIEVDPDFSSDAREWMAFLRRALGTEAQIDLLAEIVGGALLGLGARMQTAALLVGPGGAGKSTTLRVIERLMPAGAVSSVSPTRWGHEYFVAGLAGRRLNVVGELPDDRPLPAAEFKNVVGGDLIEARHPTHRPFYFRSEAQHIFLANTLPQTTDRSEAFFRRWRIVRYGAPVEADARDPDLAERITAAELPAVLAWAMRGAERAAQRGRYATTPEHDDALRRWRVASNPVLLFLLDSAHCALDPGHRERSADVYASYRAWAAENGNRPMSAQAFAALLDDTAGSIGVTRVRDATARYIQGVRLIGAHRGIGW